jgi:hypothetical protein
VDADVVVVGADALVSRGLWQYAHYYDSDPSDLDLYSRAGLAGFAARIRQRSSGSRVICTAVTDHCLDRIVHRHALTRRPTVLPCLQVLIFRLEEG